MKLDVRKVEMKTRYDYRWCVESFQMSFGNPINSLAFKGVQWPGDTTHHPLLYVYNAWLVSFLWSSSWPGTCDPREGKTTTIHLYIQSITCNHVPYLLVIDWFLVWGRVWWYLLLLSPSASWKLAGGWMKE